MSLFSFGFKKNADKGASAAPRAPGQQQQQQQQVAAAAPGQGHKSSAAGAASARGKALPVAAAATKAKEEKEEEEEEDVLLRAVEEAERAHGLGAQQQGRGKRVNGNITKRAALDKPAGSGRESARGSRQPRRAAAKRRKVLDESDDDLDLGKAGGGGGGDDDGDFDMAAADSGGSSSSSESELEFGEEEASPRRRSKTSKKNSRVLVKKSARNGKDEDEQSSTQETAVLATPPVKRTKKLASSASRPTPLSSAAKSISSRAGSPTLATPGTPKAGVLSPGEHEHHHLPWLAPDRIRDKANRAPGDPLYDPATLLVPRQYLDGAASYHAPQGRARKITPAMRLWWDFKASHFDSVLFFKVGKFYEIYHMDADIAVRHLGLMYMKGEVAHCGFPEKAYGKFSEQLVERGYKVARVEQTETPQGQKERTGKASGPVRRELCGLLSRGTRTLDVRDGGSVDALSSPVLLLALYEQPLPPQQQGEGGAASHDETAVFGVCLLDATTGRLQVGQFRDKSNLTRLRMLLAREPVAEVAFSPRNLSDASRRLLAHLCPHVPGVSGTVVHSPVPAAGSSAAAEATFALEQLRARANGYLSEEAPARGGGGLEPLEALPAVLRRYAGPEGDAAADAAKAPALAALGLCVRVLQRAKIDRRILSMRDVSAYELPGAVADDEEEDKGDGDGDARMARPADPLARAKVVLDGQAIANLELFQTTLSKTDGSLFTYMDHCMTSFGKRQLHRWIAEPLQSPQQIRARQDQVAALMLLLGSGDAMHNIRQTFKAMPDMERLLMRVHSLGVKDSDHPDSRAVLYDLLDLNKSKIQSLLQTMQGGRAAIKALGDLAQAVSEAPDAEALEPLRDLHAHPLDEWAGLLDKLYNSFDVDAAKQLGSITPRKGACPAYDEARKAVADAKASFESELEAAREAFKGLGNVNAIKFWHPSTGRDQFQIAIPETLLAKRDQPRGFTFKTKAKGTRRFHTPKIVQGLDRLAEAEAALDQQKVDANRVVFNAFDQHRAVWSRLVASVRDLDCLLSLAIVSSSATDDAPMCRPEILDVDQQQEEDPPVLELCESRHPCVAEMLEKQGKSFISNDIVVGGKGKASCMLLTGPNMGGKSTLLRQTCVATVMAQMGCWVCARKARITPVDRIFTRLGASDSIMTGQSTFFVELDETATVLHFATERSLVILDELGRGTSTHDGAAIAFAVVQRLRAVRARTLFATHYHALVDDFCEDPAVATAHMSCYAQDNEEGSEAKAARAVDVTFLYKLASGASDKSHGLNVARLAKLPEEIISRAHDESVRFEKNFLAEQIFAELQRALAPGAEEPSEAALLKLWERAKALQVEEGAAS